jgi:hypothetical protein
VEGQLNSTDTVATIQVYSTAFATDIVALAGVSEPSIGRGISGSLFGGWNGLIATGHASSGVFGKSMNGIGVWGDSEGSAGSFFKGGGIGTDIILGGSSYGNGSGSDEGVISTQPSLSSSDLWLTSNDALVIKLDNNLDETSYLEIRSGTDSPIFFSDEFGNVTLDQLQSPETNNAHLLPICFGSVDSNGDIITGSGNFSVAGFAPFTITIDSQVFNETDYVVLFNQVDQTGDVRNSWRAVDGNLIINSQEYIPGTPGAPGFFTWKNFQFSVYKPE